MIFLQDEQDPPSAAGWGRIRFWMRIVALHGFLGKVSDWDVLSLPFTPFDLFNSSKLLSLEEFGTHLNHINHTVEGDVLLGYSMGGRLALHALLAEPKKWKAAVIVSAHPGLTNHQEREERLKSDARLFQEFQQDFDSSYKKWNEAPLFSKKGGLLRKEKDYTPHMLQQSLECWSLGHQEDLKQRIQELQIPILWMAGERDKKFTELAKNMQFSHPKSKIWIAPNSFHRVVWEVKKICEQEIKIFLEGL